MQTIDPKPDRRWTVTYSIACVAIGAALGAMYALALESHGSGPAQALEHASRSSFVRATMQIGAALGAFFGLLLAWIGALVDRGRVSTTRALITGGVLAPVVWLLGVSSQAEHLSPFLAIVCVSLGALAIYVGTGTGGKSYGVR